ncbi:DUF1761 domain-containing protein [Pseudovibrio sp. SPO723]|uniref:DUF1761 domain-containing protein n=1 Tax=Nesiotobacter zosterae TaxID=392721 RepID=UPI0029C55491|nr:DUF1761 domain-containing protein [Pseudovibrio sp. SPO723]MDX5595147.1 DUF1761 domain-containing protein [Pseudovibrio sp. SPO723]
MMFDGVYLPAVAYAALASFAFGAAYYGLLSKAWVSAARLSPEQAKPKVTTLALTLFCEFVMAFVLAGVIYHTAEVTLGNGLISAAMIWVGFMLTGHIINHRYQSASWALTIIDSGHWLGVLLIQGAIYGYTASIMVQS